LWPRRRREREKLDAELDLADAKVREVELLMNISGEEAARLRAEAEGLAAELEARRELLDQHLEVMALLGRPGPSQLFFDAHRGGELEKAVGTVSVLTAGQICLFEEYHEISQQHAARLAELSATLSAAQEDARTLELRRDELESVRNRVALRLKKLERSRESADARGALPWPVEAKVVQGFGRQKQAKYSTYTVCNGLRFDVPGSAPVKAVFPGVVAFARFFKGYGNMVVLDHGHDVYSLVAGLGTIHVRVDQSVTMGMRLGLASPPAEGGNVYLEFRVGQKPQDPRRWLQLKGGSS